MNYPRIVATRFTRDGAYVELSRYPVSGYWEVSKDNTRMIFDTGRAAWQYYRHNRTGVN